MKQLFIVLILFVFLFGDWLLKLEKKKGSSTLFFFCWLHGRRGAACLLAARRERQAGRGRLHTLLFFRVIVHHPGSPHPGFQNTTTTILATKLQERSSHHHDTLRSLTLKNGAPATPRY